MFQHFKTIVAVILRFIYFPGCYHELWQNKFLQIIIFHNNFFSHVKNPACLTENQSMQLSSNIVCTHLQDWCNQSMQLSSKYSLHTFSKMMLQLVSAIFYQIFVFHQIIALQKLWKMFFISSNKLFSFLRYSNFCICIFLSFSPLSTIVEDVDPRKILKLIMSLTV